MPPKLSRSTLTTLEQQNCNLTKIKVDEVLGLVSNIAAKVPSNNYVPGTNDGSSKERSEHAAQETQNPT